MIARDGYDGCGSCGACRPGAWYNIPGAQGGTPLHPYYLHRNATALQPYSPREVVLLALQATLAALPNEETLPDAITSSSLVQLREALRSYNMLYCSASWRGQDQPATSKPKKIRLGPNLG